MRKTNLLATCLLLAALVIVASCGKKGAPFVSQKEFHLSVTNLQGEMVKGYVHLTGDLPGYDNSKEAGASIMGCRVYYAEYPKDKPPCADCPIEYQGYHGFGPEVITEAGFSCNVPGKTKGRIYFFKVYLMGPEGAMGPPSNSVQVFPPAP